MFKKLKELENFHILLWLIKDSCWCLNFKPLALLMIFPTIFMAVFISWKTFENKHDFYHNISICCWILANSIWMIGEFYFQDSLRPFSLVFFGIGLLVVFYYYVFEFDWKQSG